jgi:hypothetical protein
MQMRKVLFTAAAALLAVVGPALAQTVIRAGDDGLATPGGGTTTLDLSGYPVSSVFGTSVSSNPVVSLIGESLGPGTALAGVDTIIRRTSATTIGTSGTGTGSLTIVALRLVSESPVTIGSNSYDLRVFLSEFSSSVTPGTVTFTLANGDGGTFSSTFYVRPRLVFTNRSTQVSTVIDCGAVTCGTGRDVQVQATNVPFVISGGPGNFQPSSKQIKQLASGLSVDGDGNGVPDVTTRGPSNLFVGVAATSGFPVSGFNKYEFPIYIRPTGHYPILVIPSVINVVHPFPTQYSGGFP